MAENTATDTTENKTRRARGSVPFPERVDRLNGAAKGLAADVLGHPDDAVAASYRTMLQALAAFKTAVDSSTS